MNNEVIITCAVTGAADAVGKHPDMPVTPEQIATAAIEAAKAGAAVAHIHVRDPETGKGSRDPALFRETVERIRDSGTDVVLNLTAGMGGDLYMGPPDDPSAFDEAETDLAPAMERLVHVDETRPEICTLDCGTMNFGDESYVMVNTPPILREMAKGIRAPVEATASDPARRWAVRSQYMHTPMTSVHPHDRMPQLRQGVGGGHVVSNGSAW